MLKCKYSKLLQSSKDYTVLAAGFTEIAYSHVQRDDCTESLTAPFEKMELHSLPSLSLSRGHAGLELPEH